jgi:plastocyanin
MRRGLSAAAALALVIAVGAGAPPALSQHGAGQEAAAPIDASIGFDAVRPQHLDVLQGDTVHWTNDSVRTHTVTADDGSFDSPAPAGNSSFTAPTKPGSYPFHCSIHPEMHGTLVVK